MPTDLILISPTHGAEIGDRITVEDDRVAGLIAGGVCRELYPEELEDAKPAGRPPSIEVILAEVGEDKAAAQAALDAEAARGDDARPTLVSKLGAIIAA